MTVEFILGNSRNERPKSLAVQHKKRVGKEKQSRSRLLGSSGKICGKVKYESTWCTNRENHGAAPQIEFRGRVAAIFVRMIRARLTAASPVAQET